MEIRLTLSNLENERIGEIARSFAEKMNGVESAELDGGVLILKLSQNGSENVVKSAVTSYILSLDKEAVITEDGAEAPKKEALRSQRPLRILQIAVSSLLVAAGLFAANDTTALFVFIAAYIIIGWDNMTAVASKSKSRADIIGIAIAAVSLALFLFGLYPFGAALMIIFKLIFLVIDIGKDKSS